MNRNRLAMPLALLLATVLAGTTASAQEDRGSRNRSGGDRSNRSSESRGAERRSDRGRSTGDVAVRRGEDRRDNNRGSESRGSVSGPSDTNRSRGSSSGWSGGDRGNNRNDRRETERRYDRRDDSRPGAYREYARPYNSRIDGPRYDSRNNYRYNRYDRYDRYDRYNRYGYSNRYYGWGGDDRDYWRGRYRFGLGFSIFAGSPFSFRFDYNSWRPRYNYYYDVRPGVSYGGMSFLVNPDDTEVYIDGVFAGLARDFGGEPVPIAAGYHQIELYAEGCEPAGFDVTVMPGQVIPYRGTLNRIY